MKTYFDMDGVLADFNSEPNAIKRFSKEVGFFQKLKPTKLVSILNKQVAYDSNIYILSASPNVRADIDKMLWLYEHMPNLNPNNVIFVRNGNDKAKYAKGNILIDDYSNNLMEWEAKGGVGVKCLNGWNGKGIKWKKETLDITVL